MRKIFYAFLIINISNFLVNFREYILTFAFNRSIFQPKMHQIAFGDRGSARTRWGASSATPDPLTGLSGGRIKEDGRGGRKWEGGRKREREEGEE